MIKNKKLRILATVILPPILIVASVLYGYFLYGWHGPGFPHLTLWDVGNDKFYSWFFMFFVPLMVIFAVICLRTKKFSLMRIFVYLIGLVLVLTLLAKLYYLK